jgi:mxaK protein
MALAKDLRPWLHRTLQVASCCALAYGLAGAWRWLQDERLNQLIETRSAQLAEGASPYADFALAVAKADADATLESLAAYRRVTEESQRGLAVAAWYNSGNLHLRQAQAMNDRGDGDPERLRSAAELAKDNYRRALRLQPDYWPARYNLERALSRFPDADDDDVGEAPPIKRERAVTTMQGLFQGSP